MCHCRLRLLLMCKKRLMNRTQEVYEGLHNKTIGARKISRFGQGGCRANSGLTGLELVGSVRSRECAAGVFVTFVSLNV